MPPGKGFHYRERRPKKSLTPRYLLAGVPVLAFFAWVGMCTLGGGSTDTDSAQGQTEKQVKPTELPKYAPTRDPATKHGGGNEGAASIPVNPEKPDIKEYLIAGSRRFDLPLNVHAGVEEYFGTARGDGKVHAGVDFSLLGLKNVPVESACDGFVIEASTDEVYGTHVIIDCGGNFKAVIGWLETLRVAVGNNVGKSTVVGIGEPDGFVHVELRYKDVPLDPKDFMQIPGKEVIPWTPTPSPTPRPGDTPTPQPTPTKEPAATQASGGNGGNNNPPGATAVPTDTPTPGPPTATPTITPTPTRTPTPTKTPVPPKNTPTPLPRAY